VWNYRLVGSSVLIVAGCAAGDPRGRVTCDSSTYCVDSVCTIIDTKACARTDGG
jgi:hypothetical protein